MTQFYHKVGLKRALLMGALLALLAVQGNTGPQIPAPAGNVITLTTGTAVRLVPNPSQANPIQCNSIFIQVLPAGTGSVYVLNANPAVTMLKDSAGTTTVAQLGPGTATQPGMSFTFPSNGSATNVSSGADLRFFGVQGTTADQVFATCDLRQ